LKQFLQRDLENLLNTRCRCGSLPQDLTELRTSLVNYGIPDLTGANVGSLGSRDEFLQVIEDAIRRFEPRLKGVSVVPLDNSKEPIDRVMRFRIEAVLVTEHESEPVMFLSTMEPSQGTFEVESE
jgi:type VI secretion system protein ImpF